MRKIHELIQAFGGISKASRETRASKGAIQNWIRVDKIPHWRIDSIKRAAEAAGIDISKFLIETTAPAPGSKPAGFEQTGTSC